MQGAAELLRQHGGLPVLVEIAGSGAQPLAVRCSAANNPASQPDALPRRRSMFCDGWAGTVNTAVRRVAARAVFTAVCCAVLCCAVLCSQLCAVAGRCRAMEAIAGLISADLQVRAANWLTALPSPAAATPAEKQPLQLATAYSCNPLRRKSRCSCQGLQLQPLRRKAAAAVTAYSCNPCGEKLLQLSWLTAAIPCGETPLQL